MRLRNFTLLQTFSLLSFLCILGIIGVVCTVGGQFLTRHLVRHDAAVVADLASILLTRSIPMSYFTEPSAAHAPLYEDTVAHIVPSVDVVRIILYDAQGRVLWSDDADLIGRRFADNHELQGALKGVIEAHIIRPGKEEHEGSLRSFRRVEEIYLPIRYQRNGPIVGALEIYRHPPAFFAQLDRAFALVWILGGGGGFLLYIALVAVVRRAARTQLRLERQLTAHARTLESRVAERTRELWTLYQASTRLQAMTDVPQVLHAITEGAVDLANGGWGAITRLVDGRIVVDAVAGSSLARNGGPPPALAEGVLHDSYRTGRPIVGNDGTGVGPTVMCVPLNSPNGIVGVVQVGKRRDRLPFTDDDLRSLTTFASHAATVLEYTRLFHEIKTTKEYLEGLIESSADGIVAVDARGKLTVLNGAAQAVFGVGEKEALGRPVFAYWHRGPADFRHFRRLLIDKGRLQNYETELRGVNHHLLKVSVSASLLRDASGRVSGAFAVVRDVTHLRRMQEQMIRSERLAAAGLLAAGVAHEIGNPLTCISSLAQFVTTHTSDPILKGDLAAISLHVERIEKMLADLTRLTQPGPIELRLTSLNDTVLHAVTLARHNAVVRRMDIQTVVDHARPMVSAVPDRLVQVFLNLTLNAAEAGGALAIRTVAEGKMARVIFTDSGPGMSSEELRRAFDPFFSTKGPTRHLGLGLFVSHEIIRQHGGTILAESQPGAGSTFTVILPREP